MTSNIPEYYNVVSLRLNGVLDKIGLREDIRWKRINMWIQSEEVITLRFANGSHYFGSQPEATTTPALQSDFDQVLCSDITAVQDLENWVPHKKSVLVVSDESTPPGYVKLQPICINLPVPLCDVSHGSYCTLDRYGRSVVCNDHYHLKDQDFDHNDSSIHRYLGSNIVKYPRKLQFEHHGPASTQYLGTNLTIDRVNAVKLYAWPYQATHWLTRNRRHNWPSQETIGLIQQTGTLLVPVGHKLSQEQHLEWRVSFTYGEKLLVWLLNSTQYKCYILLKMINKSFIKPVVGDDALSSYHFKTCMFYIIENTPAAIWKPDNLLLCIEMCLRLLYIWIESKNCPNYFIPEENMFQCKMYGHMPGQLLSVLSNLLRQECRYLVRISCDNIGQKLLRTCQNPLRELELQVEDVTQVLVLSAITLFSSFKAVVEYAFKNDLNFDPRVLSRLSFCQIHRPEVYIILWKFFCSFIGSKLASQSLFEENPDQHALDLAQDFLLFGSCSDVTSGKLKLAAFYLVLGNLDTSEDVLNEIQEKYSYKILDQKFIFQHTLHALLSENLSTSQLMSQYVAFPVYYHPSEINCTPKALILEMFRSIGSNEVDSHENYLPRLVSVDPKCYLSFLEFLCYHWRNKSLHKKVALANLIYVIRYEKLAFMVTALNLLAYCLKQEGSLLSAYNILCKSMKVTRKHNAAKWHIATIINAAFNFLHGGR